jgi:hypothetical protein
MNFELNEEQIAFRAVFHTFVEKEIKPVAMEYKREETNDIMKTVMAQSLVKGKSIIV